MRQILYGAFLIGAIFAVGIVFIMTIEGQILTTGGSAKNIVTGISEDDQISDGFEQHETQKNSELENTDDGYVLHIVILILSVTTFVSILISFYLYRWRKVLLAKPNLLVPEEWGKYLAHVGGNLEKLVPVVNKNFTALSSSLNDNSEKIRNMIDTFMILQNSLDEKDREINRLKQGYDQSVERR